MVESTYRTDDAAGERLRAIAAELLLIARSGARLPAEQVRQVVTSTTLLYSAAVSTEGKELSLADPAVNATDAVVLTCALLRGQNLNPFDLTLWFGRVDADSAANS